MINGGRKGQAQGVNRRSQREARWTVESTVAPRYVHPAQRITVPRRGPARARPPHQPLTRLLLASKLAVLRLKMPPPPCLGRSSITRLRLRRRSQSQSQSQRCTHVEGNAPPPGQSSAPYERPPDRDWQRNKPHRHVVTCTIQ